MFKSRSHPGAKLPRDASIPSCLGSKKSKNRLAWETVGGVWFACGDQQLHCGVESAVARSRRHPALLTDDLEQMRARLIEGGLPIVEDRQIPGFRRFYTEDPFGNRIELLQPD